jgi:predicted AlkP superfamily phosphohydrolase/phosphomutase
MNKSNRIVVIGLDAATFDLIRPWAAEGHLPVLDRLIKSGAHGKLRSVPNANSAPAWTSFATGQNPGKHGIYYFDEPVPGTYNRRYLNGSFRRSRTLWDYLSEAGRQVGVINVPLSYPAEAVNGFMISGLDAPGAQAEGFAYPKDLVGSLRDRLGEYIIEPGLPGMIKAGRKQAAVDRLKTTIHQRHIYAEHLMKTREWDVFIVVFTAADLAQHFFWKDMDACHPDHDEKQAEVFGDTILHVYQQLDSVVGSLLETAGDAHALLLSDHGGGANQRGAEFINDWMAASGFLSIAKKSGLRRRLLGGLGALYRLFDRTFSREFKQKLASRLPGLRSRVESATCFKDIDWSATRAYGDGARDEIWINLKGREPAGIVEPGAEYDNVCEEIIAALKASRDAGSGRPAVLQVSRREDLYSGPYLDKAPDLYVKWNTDLVLTGLDTGAGDKVKTGKGADSPLQSGGHRENGIFLLSGSGVKPGVELSNAEIIDIAPTILYLSGADIPSGLDGKILSEALQADYLASRPPVFRDIETRSSETGNRDYSRKEAEKVARSLKDMGYID